MLIIGRGGIGIYTYNENIHKQALLDRKLYKYMHYSTEKYIKTSIIGLKKYINTIIGHKNISKHLHYRTGNMNERRKLE